MKPKASKKANPSIPKEMAASTTSITQKIKIYVPSMVLAVVIATTFFIHMSVPPAPEDLHQAKENWEVAKAKNTKALNALKQLNIDLRQGKITLEEFGEKQPMLVDAYTKINTEKNELFEIIVQIKSETKFLHFHSFQYFLGEIGWAVGLFLYALVNLLHALYVRNRYFKKEFAGNILLHSTLLFVGCFYTFYVFYTKDDFSREVYFIAMLLCTVALVLASKLMVDVYSRMAQYLRNNINDLIAFIFRIRNKHYHKLAVKVRHAEQEDVVLESNESLMDNYKEFDDDFYETIHKIRV